MVVPETDGLIRWNLLAARGVVDDVTAILAFLTGLLWIEGPLWTDALNPQQACPAKSAVLRMKDGRPQIVSGHALMNRLVRCSGPRLPALARQARLEGYVRILIFVDESGQVTCAHVLNGHPLIVGFALEAVRDWLFHPAIQNNAPASFYGIVAFHFSTSQSNPQSCLDARW